MGHSTSLRGASKSAIGVNSSTRFRSTTTLLLYSVPTEKYNAQLTTLASSLPCHCPSSFHKTLRCGADSWASHLR